METAELGAIGIKDTTEKPGARIEKGSRRETVVKAFEILSDKLKTTPDDSSRPEIAWLKKAIGGAEGKVDLRAGRDKFDVEFENHHTGERFVNQEGIPVDGLLKFIAAELSSGRVAPHSEEWKALRKAARTIYRSSKRYSEFPERMDPNRLVGRTHYEANFISQDERATGSMDGDWFKAEDELLNQRLELVLPEDRPRRPRPPSSSGSGGSGGGGTTPPPSGGSGGGSSSSGGSTNNGGTMPISPPTIHEISFINRDPDMRRRARELANTLIQTELRRGSVFDIGTWGRKVGLRLLEEYWRQRVTIEIMDIMKANNNVYLNFDREVQNGVLTNMPKKQTIFFADLPVINRVFRRGPQINDLRGNLVVDEARAEEEEAAKAKIEQVKLQRETNMDVGGTVASRDIKVAEGALKTAILSRIIAPMVRGEQSDLLGRQILSAGDLQEALRKFIGIDQAALADADLQRLFKDNNKAAEYFASDLLDMAQKLRADANTHSGALDALDSHTRIILANARWAAETEDDLNNPVDRLIRWSESAHRGPFFAGYVLNPLMIGAAFSLGTFVFTRLANMGARASTAAAFTPVGAVALPGIIVGTAFAALRRNYDLKMDRAVHQREAVAYGGRTSLRHSTAAERTINNLPVVGVMDQTRRGALDKFNYNFASVGDLINGGGQEMVANPSGNVDRRSLSELINGSDTEALARRIAEIRARLDFSAANKVDLLQYSKTENGSLIQGRERIEQGRLELVKAVVEARNALLRKFEEQHIRDGQSPDEAKRNAMVDLGNRETHWTGQWNDAFVQDKSQQDSEFFKYRLKQSAVVGGIAALAGTITAFGGQEAIAMVGRIDANTGIPFVDQHIINRNIHLTTAEHAVNFVSKTLGGKDIINIDLPPSIETFQEAFRTGGIIPVDNIDMQFDPHTHLATFVDRATKQVIPASQEVFLTSDGHITVMGETSLLPQSIRDAISSWQTNESAAYSIDHQIREALTNKQPTTLHVGTSDIDIRSDGTISVRAIGNAQEYAHGSIINGSTLHFEGDQGVLQSLHSSLASENFAVQNLGDNPTFGLSHFETIKRLLDTGGSLDFNYDVGGDTFSISIDGQNHLATLIEKSTGLKFIADIDPGTGQFTISEDKNPSIDFAIARRLFERSNFINIHESTVLSQGTSIDQLLNQSPDKLKAQGIVETGEMRKAWNFHVLRPDIVSSTGMHTHNELTLHVGGTYTVNSGATPEIRTDNSSLPGLVTFRGNIDGGLIPSHLDGVPPAYDPVLREMIRKTGGLMFKDMVMIVDLTDGKQVTLPMHEITNPITKQIEYGVKLPDALYDSKGGLVGVESIASGFITRADGTVIKAGELLSTGQIPAGSSVQALTSERFLSEAPKPPTPNRFLTADLSQEKPIIHNPFFDADPPKAFDLTPPTNEYYEALPPLMEFAPRFPLEVLDLARRNPPEIVYYPYGELFPEGARLRNIFRRGAGFGRGSTGYGPGLMTPEDAAEATEALKEAAAAFADSDRVYVLMDGAIGDSVISIGYFNAIIEALRKAGRNIPVTLVVNQDQGSVYDTLALGNINIVKVPRNTGLAEVRSQIGGLSENKPLVFDFANYQFERPEIIKENISGKDVTVLARLYAPAIQLYHNDNDKDRRYSHYIEDLLSLPENSIDPNMAQPSIKLPPNADAIYSSFASEFGVDPSNPKQISVVVESSLPGKRYSLDNWAQTLAKIKAEYPGYQFNIIFNSGSSTLRGGYTQTDIENALNTAGVLSDSNVIDASRKDLAEVGVFLSRQKLVLSNDTGLGHIAGAIENGPQVVTLFMPRRFSPRNWISTKRQKSVLARPDRDATIPPGYDPSADFETDETKKYINLIDPEDIMQQVRTVAGL